MSLNLKLWAKRPFELIHHAEIHYRLGRDYDRRLSIISFDNAIEASISCYLNLHPKQRGGKTYPNINVDKWLKNFHSKIGFFIGEVKDRGLPEQKDEATIIFFHKQRNEQYHGSGSSIPDKDTLDGIRQVALWVFSVLFETPDIEAKLESSILKKGKDILPTIPKEYAVPKELQQISSDLDFEKEKVLISATILGKWDENNENDKEVIKKVINEF